MNLAFSETTYSIGGFGEWNFWLLNRPDLYFGPHRTLKLLETFFYWYTCSQISGFYFGLIFILSPNRTLKLLVSFFYWYTCSWQLRCLCDRMGPSSSPHHTSPTHDTLPLVIKQETLFYSRGSPKKKPEILPRIRQMKSRPEKNPSCPPVCQSPVAWAAPAFPRVAFHNTRKSMWRCVRFDVLRFSRCRG